VSLEAITKIRAVEEDMERSKADAKAQAQKLIADADREGRSLLQQGREKASAAAAAAMKKAEEEAAGLRDKILAQSAKDCEKLKSDARARMDKAAQAIIGRVVER
jgi:V/A-type H+-transporting ATPase subunit G/H